MSKNKPFSDVEMQVCGLLKKNILTEDGKVDKEWVTILMLMLHEQGNATKMLTYLQSLKSFTWEDVYDFLCVM